MKNKPDLLGVFGDSFASNELSPVNRPGEPWVLTLSKLLNLKEVVYSKSGTSIWWSFKNFLKYYKNFSHIVFVYSQHNRWHSLINDYEDMHHITIDKFPLPNSNNSDEAGKVRKILLDAYPIVNSEQFDLYVYQKIFNDVNKICKDNNIKLINFMPFDDGGSIDYSSSHGFCIYNVHPRLIDFEIQHLTNYEKKQFAETLFSGDRRYCHMNWKNNYLVACHMFENFDNTQGKLNIMEDEKISSDPECIRSLLQL